MHRLKADLCIIGAGPGGLSLAAGAAQLGVKVILVESGKMGGDCLNAGCVPSKALLAAAKAAHLARGNPNMGVVVPNGPQVDLARAKAYVAEVIAKIAPHDSQERFEALGVTVIRAWGRFVSPKMLEAGPYNISARRFVIATGARAFVPPISGISTIPFLTNETVFNPTILPDHLIIIGAGSVGVEMAQAHRRLGVRVSLIDADPLLSRDDPELSAYVKNALLSEGVELYTEQKIQSIEQAHGEIRLDIAGGVSIKGSHVLIAAGRVAQVDGLNLHLADVKIGKNGIIAGPDLRTTNKRIYAMGDALQDGLRFTHVAGYHAGVLVRSLLFGLRAGQKTQHIPRVTYSDPELAQVGLTEAQARLLYHDKITVISQSLALSDRAQTQGKQDQGLIKLIVHKGRAIGVGITGPNAGELISIWALVLAEGVKLSALARAVFPYPTLSEISKRAVGTYFSPKLFGNAWIRYWVLFVQRYL